MKSAPIGLHMSFTGSPGTGYIEKGQLITVTRDDLVGQYIGHTAPKTKEVLKRAMGGVMENQREDLVVIFAGYKDRMDSFYESNPGLSSRVANHIDFPDYTADELLQIARLILEEQQYRMTPDAEALLLHYVAKRREMPLFANARTVTNAIDTARMRHANRMFNSGNRVLTKSDLVTIQAEDIRESSLFSEISGV
eukprot:scaffold51549_cov1860-Isochrysis_galbana.AAC.7